MNNDMHAKMLNKLVTGDKFVDKDINDYIYASLSQPPIKIIDKNGSENELDYTVECPTCGAHIIYGEQTFMIHGYVYCDSKGCREKAYNRYEHRSEL